jgi:hypothetical protein
MRAYDFNGVKNNPDINELTEYNKKCMTIVLPDKGINPPNPNAILARIAGCQMVAMRYQFVDNFLKENAIFFNESGYAFALKPENLRDIPITVPAPSPQDPAVSYDTRTVTTKNYSYNI